MAAPDNSGLAVMTNGIAPVRLAMWSGPRNISTAMMRSWGNRADTLVVDEPFYAFYLCTTGKDHPGAEEVIADGDTDWRRVVERLTGDLPAGKRVFFQKQMTHHLLPEIDREWMLHLTNCFLIRDPREVIPSYIKKNSDPTLEDLGFIQQKQIFDFVRRRTNSIPPVIDAADVLRAPQLTLRLLCHAVGIEFDPAMLSWPVGLRETDGVWARHWYHEVAQSTSFRPYRPRPEAIPNRLQNIYDGCRDCYEQLYPFRLREKSS